MPSHGSLSKAGKVRDQNKKDWRGKKRLSKKSKIPFQHNKKHKFPRLAWKRRYEKFLLRKKLLKMGLKPSF